MRTKESTLRDGLRLLVWGPGRILARVLPSRLAMTLFERAGHVHARISPHRASAVARRIGESVGPRGDLASQGRAALGTHYADRLHILLYDRIARWKGCPSWLTVQGRDHLDAALRAGKGAVLVHPHYAVPQLLPLGLGLEGYRCLQLGLPSAEGLSPIGRNVSFKARLDLEAKLPARILPADGYLRPAFAWLEAGGVVLVTGDGTGGGRFRGRHIEIPFLGRRMLFPVGPAKLALATGAPLLPAIVLPAGQGRYRARIEAALATSKATPEELTASFARFLEGELRRQPGPWHFWDDFEAGNLLVEPEA